MKLNKAALIVTVVTGVFTGTFATHLQAQVNEPTKPEVRSFAQSQMERQDAQLRLLLANSHHLEEKQRKESVRIAAYNDFKTKVEQMDTTKIDLREPSGLTPEQAEVILMGSELAGLGEAFVQAEQLEGVNAYYLIAHAAWESGWGTSRLSKEKNNLFGFGAFDDSPYESAKHFETKADCIMAVASYIREHYLEESGNHYNGPTLKGMNIKYASDKNWADGIAEVIDGLVFKTEELAMIP